MLKQKKFSLQRSVMLVMIAILISRLTGFVKEVMIPNKLGIGLVGDAYNIAVVIPDVIYNLLIGGAIAAALIPVLTSYIHKGNEKDGWKSISSFLNFSFIAMAILCVFGMIFTEQLIQLFTTSYIDDSIKLDLTIRLTRILLPSIIFLMLAGICNGVLNSYNKFFISTLGPAIYNVFCIFSLLFLSYYGVEAVATGVLFASAIYFVCQLLFSMKHFKLYKAILNFKDKGFSKILSLYLPAFLSSSIVQINTIIAVNFASGFLEGSVTAYRTTDRLWQFPYAIISQAIGITILPSLAALALEKNMTKFKELMTKGLSYTFIFCIPFAIVFAVSGKEIADVFFRFTEKVSAENIILIAQILAFFAIAVVFQSQVTVLNRAFYAVNDTKTPFFTGAISVVCNFVLIIILKEYFAVAGIALAYSLASFINALLLTIMIHKRVVRLELREITILILKVVASGFVTASILMIMTNSIPMDSFTKISKVVILFGEVCICGLVYIGLMMFMKIELINTPLKRLYNRINAKNVVK